MKKFLLISMVLILSGNIFSQENTYYPQVFFNKNEAQNMLALGKSTIEGVAFTREKQNQGFGIKTKTGKKHYAKKGTVVFLLPCTEYFYEWHKLRKKKESKKTYVLMSEEAFKYRIETTTDEYGRFKFEKMKPGKYYLETDINFTATASYQKQTGRTDYYNGFGYQYSTPVYSTFFYNYQDSNRESKFVEITEDAQLISIKL